MRINLFICCEKSSCYRSLFYHKIGHSLDGKGWRRGSDGGEGGEEREGRGGAGVSTNYFGHKIRYFREICLQYSGQLT